MTITGLFSKQLSVVTVAFYLIICKPMTAAAIDIQVTSGSGYWVYKESSVLVPGLALTPLKSSARGYMYVGEVSVDGALSDNWAAGVSINGALPANKAIESWSLPNSYQSNDLEIIQFQLRGNISRDLGPFRLGAWTSYRFLEQRRSRFYVNGVSQVVAGAPISERIKSIWGGIACEAKSIENHLTTTVSAGLPMWVETTNSFLPGTKWSSKKGYMFDINVMWAPSWNLRGRDITLDLDYQYQELGGQVVNRALWPKNSFQLVTVKIGVLW